MLIIEPESNLETIESTLIREIKNELDGYVITRDIAPYAGFDTQYDHNNLYIENRFNSFLDAIEKNNYPYQKIFNNHYIKWEEFENFYTTPIFFLNSVESFSQLDISQYNYTDQTNIFAMMHKPREARYIVSAWLLNSGITDFNYTQGWNLDPGYINKLSDLVRRHRENLTTFLPRNFIDGPLSYKSNNAYLFDNFFKPYFCSSTIAIVTEPVFFEKASLITEKYLSAIYGCCFPIFCGGYNMANDIKEIGFDVFDDIIDHSYQTEPDPTMRVLDALNINSEILYGKTLKKTDYMHRHKKNLELVRQRRHEFYKQFAKDLELIPKNETARNILMKG